MSKIYSYILLFRLISLNCFQNVSKWMTETFANMAKRGDPNPITKTGGQKVEWKKYEKSEKQFFVFGTELDCSELSPEVTDRIDFWNEVVAEAGLLKWTTSQKPIPELHSQPAEKRTQ